MKISELARRTGVSAHALRHYDRLGLIAPPRRPGGYRDYDAGAVRDVRFVVAGRRLGFALKDLRDALPAYRAGRLSVDDGIAALERRIAEIDRAVTAQLAQRAELAAHLQRLRDEAPR